MIKSRPGFARSTVEEHFKHEPYFMKNAFKTTILGIKIAIAPIIIPLNNFKGLFPSKNEKHAGKRFFVLKFF